ncbi:MULTISPECIES: DUF4365 domain-containing protein [Dolichospermum]|uniref:DUF4365 domain-containing protein n=1 Tax=Dolichospermum heterosporum TAC447 TaxID=747523 RepID=A0ABY5LVN4_9CYAN|nr:MULTISPECIES: DUF4365 domain-containing protein [Dolichospermum]MBE9258927.1 DUF4365 domain-containing protein [Dolichospermum sp. LEGE 00246]MDK2411813.1 DUF4365 domain-containing protein [Aphanizomenon sp. 202]MDK2458306.1 DUF4365 domain-containing protein [Aphanizomenon sp. PH219]UUO16068.1 DUF4365 domain-containing protein [Dolichospermum heterosporum TAC447]
MHITQCQEQFGNAYIRVITAVSGYSIYKPEVDDDSIDLGIAAKGGMGTFRSPRLEIQLKAPFRRNIVGAESISYPLSRKNYDDLRYTNVYVPRILVIVVLADDINSWLHQCEEQLIMKHCAYWTSLRGEEELPTGQESKSVRLSRDKIFNVEALESLMQIISNGGTP